MSQRYKHPVARERMSHGLCPECGMPADMHIDDARFWIPRRCDLLPGGVRERVEQYREDESGGAL
jgi:hypothetical protein